MADNEKIHIAIAPLPALDVDLINNVADSIDKSPYNTRLLLAGKVPKIIVHRDDMQAAESIVESLRALGLAALAFTDSELRRSTQRFIAHTLEFRDRELLFRDSNGNEQRMGENDVFLILEGKVQISTETEATTTKTKLNLPMTLLTGGIPVQRKVKEKTITTSVQAEYFIRLYGRESPHTFIEARPHLINYSFLGTEIAVSSMANFTTVIKRLRELFPRAIFDDRLTKPFNVSTSSGREWEDIETTCKLIYSFYRSPGQPDAIE